MKCWINHCSGPEGRRSASKRPDILRALFITDDGIILDVVDQATDQLRQKSTNEIVFPKLNNETCVPHIVKLIV